MITNERNKERITFYPFFLAHWTFVNFFGLWTKYAGFFSYLYALPGYTEYTFFSKSNHFFQNQTAPHPTHPPLPPPPPHIARLRNGPPEQSWNFPRLIFPLLRNMCFMFQSFIIITFQVRCMFFAFIRNFVTYAELI